MDLPENRENIQANAPNVAAELTKVLNKYPEIIFTDEKHTTRTNLVQCKIWIKHDRPIKTRLRPLSPEKRQWLQKEVDELLAAGVICPSHSPYAAAPVIVKKKDGTWRLALNYRPINKDSYDFLYPLPKIAEIFDQFNDATWFTSLDLVRGYWQIAMDPDSIKYTTFIIPFGQYEFLVMPFRLK